MRYQYATNCTESTYEAIHAMLDTGRDISRRTFLKYVDRDSLAELANNLGYSAHPRQGLTMAGDWHVSYHRGKYRGRPCVYLCWSAIEYIFTQGGAR